MDHDEDPRVLEALRELQLLAAQIEFNGRMSDKQAAANASLLRRHAQVLSDKLRVFSIETDVNNVQVGMG